MPEIVVTEFMDEAAVMALKARFETHYDPDLADKPDAIAELLSDARALIVRNRTQVRGALLESVTRLTCVGRLGVGLDNIDVAACDGRGIAVFPATGANNLSVAEYVITSAMALLRGAYQANGAMIAGQWPRQALMGRELAGKTMGLVGFGAIAREVAQRARALGMKVAAHDPMLDATDDAWAGTDNLTLDDLLTTSDVISLHVPLTSATRHMIDSARLRTMRPDAIVINAARGGVVDDGALADALRAGHIAGAALDVFETEPPTAEAGKRFAGLSNLILTPHIAGVTEESNVRVSHMIAETVLSHLESNAQ